MLKKLFVIASLQTLSLGLFAQIKNEKGTFEKPKQRAIIFEMNLAPNITGGGMFSLNDPFLQNLYDGLNKEAMVKVSGLTNNLKMYLPMMKVRYFYKDNIVLRAQANLIYSTAKRISGTKNENAATGSFALAIGAEKHSVGAERLASYYGADVLIGFSNLNASNDNTKENASQTGFGIGIRAVTGFEYYFIPKVYLGTEFGFGLGLNNYGTVKTETGDTQQSSSDFALTPFINPVLRLGFIL
jgi:hypothetical protein